MINYSRTPRYGIEDVDYEIEIVGIKLGHLMVILGQIPFTMKLINPLFAIVVLVLECVFSKLCYEEEKRGRPVFLSKTFLKVIHCKQALLRRLFDIFFKDLKSLHFKRTFYRS